MRLRLQTFEYRCFTEHYQYSCYVRAYNLKQARTSGYHEAKRVMGNHARIQRDEIHEVK